MYHRLYRHHLVYSHCKHFLILLGKKIKNTLISIFIFCLIERRLISFIIYHLSHLSNYLIERRIISTTKKIKCKRLRCVKNEEMFSAETNANSYFPQTHTHTVTHSPRFTHVVHIFVYVCLCFVKL